jgi:hypothetical protein
MGKSGVQKKSVGNTCWLPNATQLVQPIFLTFMISRRVAYNLVFYRERPQPGHRYRQIAVLRERNGFQVCIFEGEAIQADAKMIAMRARENVRSHSDFEEAIADAQQESRKTKAAGWIRYRFTTRINAA